jgi:hypothetical protein
MSRHPYLHQPGINYQDHAYSDAYAPAHARQVGGSHYQGRGIEPWDIIAAWDLDFWEGNVLKYLLRRKPGVPRTEDLRKAMHYLEKCLERASAAENPAPLA